MHLISYYYIFMSRKFKIKAVNNPSVSVRRAGFPRPGDTWADFLMVQSEEGWRYWQPMRSQNWTYFGDYPSSRWRLNIVEEGIFTKGSGPNTAMPSAVNNAIPLTGVYKKMGSCITWGGNPAVSVGRYGERTRTSYRPMKSVTWFGWNWGLSLTEEQHSNCTE